MDSVTLNQTHDVKASARRWELSLSSPNVYEIFDRKSEMFEKSWPLGQKLNRIQCSRRSFMTVILMSYTAISYRCDSAKVVSSAGRISPLHNFTQFYPIQWSLLSPSVKFHCHRQSLCCFTWFCVPFTVHVCVYLNAAGFFAARKSCFQVCLYRFRPRKSRQYSASSLTGELLTIYSMCEPCLTLQ